jgi:hypothetical protein
MADNKFKLHKKINVTGEPIRDWIRNDFVGGHPEDTLLDAEIITDRDLNKPIEQLLCDIEETHIKWKKIKKNPESPEKNNAAIELILYGIVRSASMNAVVALENRKTQEEMRTMTKTIKHLTWALVALTIGILFLTGFMVSFNPPVITCNRAQQNLQTINTQTNFNDTQNMKNNARSIPGHSQK